MSSQIAAIVDYSAWRAATSVQNVVNPMTGLSLGVRSVFGAGQNLYPDPLRPGEMIAPADEKPVNPYCHVSELPDAPGVVLSTQDVVDEYIWTVPMRFYVPKGDKRVLRATLLPFFDAYLSAFRQDIRLGDLCLTSYLTLHAVEVDDDWAWLPMDLVATEVVSWP